MLKRVLLLWSVLALLPVHAFAEENEVVARTPEEVQITTPVYKPYFELFEPSLGRYEYTVAWQGIPAADITVDVDRDGENYRIRTTAKTYKAIDLFYKLRYQAEGLIDSDELVPRKTLINQRENSRVKNYEILFKESGDIRTVKYHNKDGTEVVEFNPHNFTLDPFSAAFLARSLDWKVGDRKKFDTFNGKSRYLITMTAVDKTSMKVNGEKRDVWVISPTVKKLNGKPHSKLREAHIYVTADKKREILMLRSEVFIGAVTTELTSFRPRRRGTEGTRLASNTEKYSLSMLN